MKKLYDIKKESEPENTTTITTKSSFRTDKNIHAKKNVTF